MGKCSIEKHDLGLVIRTYWDRDITPRFSADLKSRVPPHSRKWTGKEGDPKNVWIVDPVYGKVLQQLIDVHYNEKVRVPVLSLDQPVKTGRFKVLYVGTAKERDDGSKSAFGMDYDTSEWRFVFDVNVLENWFDNVPLKSQEERQPSMVPRGSHYAVLGLKSTEVDVGEIKSAWRRMVRQWHPDVCQEPNAQEMFMKIQKAYELLSDDKLRKRYDVGLVFAGSTQAPPNALDAGWDKTGIYRPALRCGFITVKYTEMLGRVVVNEILKWEDITNGRGETLVVTWGVTNNKPNPEPTLYWVP